MLMFLKLLILCMKLYRFRLKRVMRMMLFPMKFAKSILLLTLISLLVMTLSRLPSCVNLVSLIPKLRKLPLKLKLLTPRLQNPSPRKRRFSACRKSSTLNYLTLYSVDDTKQIKE